MVTKREFFSYFSSMYDEDFQDDELYKTFKSLVKIRDVDQIMELKKITRMDRAQRMQYRYALAVNGKELTPRQVDQYISMIEYALLQIEE